MSWLISKAMMSKYGNSLSLPEQVEEFSADIFADGEQCAPLKSTHTQRAYCAPDRMTEFSRLSRFGMMCEPLTDDNGAAVLTLYLADFPVRISQSRGKAQDLKAHDQDSGKNSSESLAKFDLDSYSWKIHQLSLFGGGYESLQTLPRWGMTRGGELFPLKTPALHTNGSEYGFWPTPQAIDANGNGRAPRLKKDCNRDPQKKGSWRADLKDAVLKWPTPRSSDGSHGGMVTPREGREGENLIEAVSKRMFPTPTQSMMTMQDMNQARFSGADPRRPKYKAAMFPTPTVQDSKNNGSKSQQNRNSKPLNAEIGGALNPTWVEWLMGWPLEWTELKPLEMDKFRQWYDSHVKYSEAI